MISVFLSACLSLPPSFSSFSHSCFLAFAWILCSFYGRRIAGLQSSFVYCLSFYKAIRPSFYLRRNTNIDEDLTFLILLTRVERLFIISYYDDHVWSSYVMSRCDDRLWWSHMIIVNNDYEIAKVETHSYSIHTKETWSCFVVDRSNQFSIHRTFQVVNRCC